MFLVSSCSCLRSTHWSQVISWEWKCCWSSADRRCSNYIWVINNFITYQGATYIRGFTLASAPEVLMWIETYVNNKQFLGIVFWTWLNQFHLIPLGLEGRLPGFPNFQLYASLHCAYNSWHLVKSLNLFYHIIAVFFIFYCDDNIVLYHAFFSIISS